MPPPRATIAITMKRILRMCVALTRARLHQPSVRPARQGAHAVRPFDCLWLLLLRRGLIGLLLELLHPLLPLGAALRAELTALCRKRLRFRLLVGRQQAGHLLVYSRTQHRG